MIKTFIFTAIAALGVMAAPASAEEFTGPRLGASVGYDNIQGHEDVAYGVVAGYDAKVAPKVTVGVDATFGDSTVSGEGIKASRDLGLNLRAGYIVTPRVLAFGKVGYATTRFEVAGLHTNLEAVRFGGGLEYAVTKNTFVSAEYVRTEYEADFGGRDTAMVTVGLRF